MTLPNLKPCFNSSADRQKFDGGPDAMILRLYLKNNSSVANLSAGFAPIKGGTIIVTPLPVYL
ncbi:hypothetical protein QUB63_11930 [Microcoleus sp. ARI1-B5]|uniref:hypothetical protein n=1 Tax=unclassified Microcoleus TaxID=2642155 RepID=UPI002FCF1C67